MRRQQENDGAGPEEWLSDVPAVLRAGALHLLLFFHRRHLFPHPLDQMIHPASTLRSRTSKPEGRGSRTKLRQSAEYAPSQ
jgi:hypothetical protein